jgi:hypothetical protein
MLLLEKNFSVHSPWFRMHLVAHPDFGAKWTRRLPAEV